MRQNAASPIGGPDSLRAACGRLDQGAKLLSTRSAKLVLHTGDLVETVEAIAAVVSRKRSSMTVAKIRA